MARALLIGQYLHSAGCPAGNSACDVLAATIAIEAASTSAGLVSSPTAVSGAPSATQTPPIVHAPAASALQRASPTVAGGAHAAHVPEAGSAPASVAAAAAASGAIAAPPLPAMRVPLSPPYMPNPEGNALLRNLPSLFVLNALFQHDPSGILSPGGASLGNVIILYQIFFASHLFSL